MIVTDKLRYLLDERGVKWDYGIAGATTTEFKVNGVYLTFMPMRDGLVCSTVLTPEQAIAATLGPSNCSDNCTDGERTETCHDKGTFKSWGFFTCSNCSIVFPLDAVKDTPSIGRTLPPKYCPNCGRKVVN